MATRDTTYVTVTDGRASLGIVQIEVPPHDTTYVTEVNGKQTLGVVSSGFAVPTTMLMSSRANHMGYAAYAGSDGVDLDSNTRLSFFNETGAAVTKLRMYFQNSRAISTNESDGYNTINIKAALEYPAGVYTPLTFSAASSVDLAAGAALAESDELTGLSIPADTEFFVRTYVSVTTGLKWVQGYTIATARGEAADFGTAVDKTTSGTITNATATATRRGYGPSAIKATGFSGSGQKARAFAAIGDSIVQGVGGLIDTKGNTGWIGFAMSGRYPYLNVGYTGTRAVDNTGANVARRKALILAAGITDLIVEYGVNDINTSQSSATTLAALTAIHNEFPDIRVWQTTITPMTTSTDQFDTSANQAIKTTPAGVFTGGAAAVRHVLNNAIRAVPTPLYGVYDAADFCEPSRDSGLFLTQDVSSSTHLQDAYDLVVGAGSTTTVVTYTPPMTANALAFGGALVFTSGALSGTRVAVTSNNTTTITVPALASAPVEGVTMKGYPVNGRFTGDGTHPLANSLTNPGFGGQFIMKDALIALIS